MKGFVDDIRSRTDNNRDFRRVLYTGPHMQLVLMALAPGEEIGEEVHEDTDQFFRLEEGRGVILIDGVETHIAAVFAKLPDQLKNGLKEEHGWQFYSFIGGGSRLMCSWRTMAEDVDAFVADAARFV